MKVVEGKHHRCNNHKLPRKEITRNPQTVYSFCVPKGAARVRPTLTRLTSRCKRYGHSPAGCCQGQRKTGLNAGGLRLVGSFKPLRAID